MYVPCDMKTAGLEGRQSGQRGRERASDRGVAERGLHNVKLMEPVSLLPVRHRLVGAAMIKAFTGKQFVLKLRIGLRLEDVTGSLKPRQRPDRPETVSEKVRLDSMRS